MSFTSMLRIASLITRNWDMTGYLEQNPKEFVCKKKERKRIWEFSLLCQLVEKKYFFYIQIPKLPKIFLYNFNY